MNVSITLFYNCFLSLLCSVVSYNSEKIEAEKYNQAREIAIQDFSKTKLFKKDSVFNVSLYDTLHRMTLEKINERNFTWVNGKAYPEIIAVNITANPLKYLLDTTSTVDIQNKTIPSRVFEKNGRVFLWWDKHYPLTDSALRTLDKFHLIKRGIEKDWYKLFKGTDDSKRGAHYYFCRNDLSIHKKVITNTAIGYYDPPSIACK